MEGSWVPRSPKAVNRVLDVNRLISLIKKEDSHFRDLEKFGIKAVVAMFIKGPNRGCLTPYMINKKGFSGTWAQSKT